MKNLLLSFFVTIALLLGTRTYTFAQTTETFESSTSGFSSFTSNGVLFTLTPSEFKVDDLAGYGYLSSNKFIDNYNTSVSPCQIKSASAFCVKSLYLYPSELTEGNTNQTSGVNITFKGKLAGSLKFTYSPPVADFAAADWQNSTNRGFSLVNFATPGFDNIAIDELEISLGGTTVYFAYDNFVWALAPTVISISPSSGPTVGGTAVTITGTNFTGATSVTIGGTAATSMVVTDATTITAVTPAGTAGMQDVVVTTPGGIGTGTGLFNYLVYSLGNRVWFDTDNSGTINGAEVGVSGVRVELYQDNGGTPGIWDSGDTFVGFVTTDASGYYRFDNLSAGDYVVKLPAVNFTVGNPLNTYWSSGTSIAVNGTVSDGVNSDPDNNIDSDDNGVTTFSGNTINYISSQAITLGPGITEPTNDNDPATNPLIGEAPNNQSNRSVDFGFYCVALSNQIFVDDNNNGNYDAGETALPGATVNLYASDGTTLLFTTVTGAGGTYFFSGLAAGDYIVKVTPPAGYKSTVDTDNIGDTTNPNNNIDNNDNGVGTGSGQVSGNIITLTPGNTGAAANNTITNAIGTTTDPTLDFGFSLPAPEMDLKQGSSSIGDGGIYNFGTQGLNSNTDIVFTIANTGSANLILTTPITIGGTDAGQFSLQAQPTSPVTASGSTTFTVRFTPTSTGAKTATISIANNDGNENPYDLTITGEGDCSTITVTNNADSGAGSLRQAIADVCSNGTISFDNDYTILLSSELVINKNLTITGTGHSITVSGNHITRVFNLTGGTINMIQLTIADGYLVDLSYSGISGAGIYIYGATLNVNNSTFSGNMTGWPGGGGIQLEIGTANVNNCTFVGNSAVSGGYGGGIDNFSSSTMNLTNSTFSGNSAASAGGGISAGGIANIINCTISGNSSGWAGGGGGINNEAGVVTIKNSIIAKNPTGNNCWSHYGASYPFYGSNNLADDGTGGAGFINSSSILLGTLGNYGGSTQTFPLLPGSSAIDAGNNSVSPATDQRGITRPINGNCDIGAFESRGFTMTKTGGDIQSTNVNTAFTNPLALSIASTFGEPVNDGVVSFAGPASGASTNPVSKTATIAAGAVTCNVIANGVIGGSYNVNANAAGANNINFALTNTATTVSSVSVPSNATYIVSQNLDFTVNFNGAVTVVTTGGTPYIPITLNTGGSVNAAYQSGSGTTALVFRYTIVSGNEDTDGISVGASITANGGTLKDFVGNDVFLTLNSVGSTAGVLVDGIAPTVSSVGVPSNTTYVSSQNLNFTVNFSEAVTVVTTGGTPYIPVTLNTGGSVNAAYLSGSGTTALVFRYTVVSGNEDTDGISVGASITANGGTLKDAAGNNAVLTLNSVGSTAGVLVDAINPTVSSVGVPSNATYVASQNLDFTVNCSEAVIVVTTGGTPYLSITLNTGGSVNAAYLSGSGTSSLIFRYTVVSGNEDTNGISVGASIIANGGTLKDAAGNNAILTLNSVGSTTGVLVDAIAPTVSSVGVPSNATYVSSQNLNFTVNFSEAVTVVTTGGTPYIPITLNSGGSVNAAYLSGSGTTALVFRYTVVSGNEDTDGISVGASITANGGTLKDAAGNNAVLTLNSVGSTAGVLVDAIAPNVTNVTSTKADDTYGIGETIIVTVTFSEPVTVTGIPQLELETGLVDRTINYSSGTGTSVLSFTFTTQSGDESADLDYKATNSLTLNGGTIQDAVGNNGTLTLATPGTTNSLGANKAIVIQAFPTVTLSVGSSSIIENAGNSTITATLSQTSSQDVTVSLSYSGTATNGTDYNATASTSITVPAGNISANAAIGITSINDALVEGDETIIIDISGVTKGFEDGMQQQTVTFTDDDYATLRVTRKANSYENVSDGAYWIITDKQFEKDVQVGVSVMGTATAGVDYTSIATPQSFPAFTDTLTVTVAQIDDSESEVNEYVIMNLVITNNVRVDIAPAPDSTATVTIFDDDMPLVTLSQSVTTFTEATGQNILTATLNKVHHTDVVATIGATGTATATTDYSMGTTITIIAGNLTGTTTITAVQDQLVETDETIVVDILSVTNGVENGTQQVTSTILDDDTSILSIAATTDATEDNTDGLLTITASKQFDVPVTVTLTVNGTTIAGTDYTAIPTTIVLPAFTSTFTIPVDVIADNLVEPDETVIITLTGTSHAKASIALSPANAATVKIIDNDIAHISIVTSAEGAEGLANGYFTISTDKMFSIPVTVDILTGGLATNGADYTTISSTVVFPAYSSSVSVPVIVIDDLLVEGGENVSINMVATSMAPVLIKSGSSMASLNIKDNDFAHIYVTSYGNAREADITGLFNISSDKPVERDVPIQLTLGGTATMGSDYNPISLPVIFPAHQGQLDLVVFPISDEIVEGNETVTLSVNDVSNENVIFSTLPGAAAIINIVDDDIAHFTISAIDHSGEGDADCSFIIKSTKIFPVPVTLHLVFSGTAIQGVDFNSTSSEFIFPASRYSDTLTVPVIDDNLVEGDETINLTIDHFSHPGAIFDKVVEGQTTAIISDNDFAKISIERVNDASENGTIGLFTIKTDRPVETGVTISLARLGSATEGVDYMATDDYITLPAHTLSLQLPINPLPDDLDENFENVMVVLTKTSNKNVSIDAPSNSWASLVIEDDDPEPFISILPVTGSEGSGSLQFSVKLSHISGTQVQVGYNTSFIGDALPDVDFSAISGTLIFLPGDKVKVVEVTVKDDLIEEYDESFQLLLVNPRNADISINNGIGTIIDNDTEPLVSISFTKDKIIENGGKAYLKASLNKPSGKKVIVVPTFTGSAILGKDYTPGNDSLFIYPGKLSDSISILSLNDDLVELNETVIVASCYALNAVFDGTFSKTLIITDQDQTISFGALPSKKYGDADFTLNAVSTSGLDVVFVSSNVNVARITGKTVKVTGAGTATITASQPGNEQFEPASVVTQTLTVGKAQLTIAVNDVTVTYGDKLPDLSENVTINLLLKISGFVNGDNANVVDTKPVLSTTASKLSDAGEYPVTIGGGSDNNYDFIYVNGKLTINKAPQTITFGELPEVKKGDGPLVLVATSTSGLEVTFESSNLALATISGNQALIVKSGTVNIIAKQAGNMNYLPAADVTRTLVIKEPNVVDLLQDAGPLCYPNPFDKVIYLDGVCEKAKSVNIYDLNGKRVLSQPVPARQINSSVLRDGVYLLEIDFGQGIKIKRQMIKK